MTHTRNYCRNCGTSLPEGDVYCSPECQAEAHMNFLEECQVRDQQLRGLIT